MVRVRVFYENSAQIPFTVPPLRLPGQSARAKADNLLESAHEKMLLALSLAAIFAATMSSAPRRQPIAFISVMFVLVACITLTLGAFAVIGVRRSWNYRLGAIGEQVVGRELDRLIARGHRVFHDLDFGRWNIDHVVVGPTGVFAIDTKTRRKPKGTSGGRSKVTFDGATLSWNGWKTSEQVQDARRGARSLEIWLREKINRHLPVVPVIAIPGWWLNVVRFGDVAVYSAAEMSEHLPRRGKLSLDEAQIDEIARCLEALCRMDPSV